VVQRADVEALAPNDEMDPEFGNALRGAADKGVEALSYRLAMRRTDARLAGRIPILLN
jgi:sugar fermentation stimulation protein A